MSAEEFLPYLILYLISLPVFIVAFLGGGGLGE